MADTALDLSKPAPLPPTERVAPLPQTPKMRDMSSDSGRASASSTSSTDETRPVLGETDPRDEQMDVKPTLPLLSPEPEDRSDEDIESGEDREMSDRMAPIRPFKMYPMDAYSMANTSLPGMAAAAGMSPTTAAGLSPASLSAMSGMMDPASVSPFALTPMTSHLLQRKRRAENRNTSLEDMKKMNPVPEEKKDDSYWERRRKNNEAAKRSRDARRMKEEEIAMRAAFLEQENLKLRAQVAILKNETAKLHYMLYNRM